MDVFVSKSKDQISFLLDSSILAVWVLISSFLELEK